MPASCCRLASAQRHCAAQDAPSTLQCRLLAAGWLQRSGIAPLRMFHLERVNEFTVQVQSGKYNFSLKLCLKNAFANDLEDAMLSEQNKVIAQKCFDAVNRQDPLAMAEVLSPKWTAEIISWFPGINDRWPGHHVEVTGMLAEDDLVWCRLRTNGVSMGEWMGLSPNGKLWTNTGIWFMRIAGGKIIEIEWLFDQLNLVRQFGGKVVPVNAET